MFTLIMEYIYRQLLKYDEIWCDTMCFFNPYTDPFNIMYSQKVPMFDKQAYNMYPRFNFVYDKLWVCKSQGLKCGNLELINDKFDIKYPIFIKPRWGHLSASSKNCFKIKSYEELLKYKHLKDMMWSEYIDGKEYMTDYIMLNGKIIFQTSYEYSKEQYGYIDKWKYISNTNEPIDKIDNWVKEYMIGYSGILNIQMRDDKIIEVGLRPARGGAYLQSTDNVKIIEMINAVYDKNIDIIYNPDVLDFKPYYSFKCFTRVPFFYIFPQYFIDLLMYTFKCKPFYEYYFEPNGRDGMVWFQFLHDDFNTGNFVRYFITILLVFSQIFFILLIFYIFYDRVVNKKFNKLLIIIVILLYLTNYLNPISVQYNWHKSRKQKIFL